MKKLVLFAVAAMLAMNMAQAADDKNKKDKGKGGIQILLTKLDLNADQKKKLGEFNKAHQEKYDQARKLKELKAAKKGKKKESKDK